MPPVTAPAAVGVNVALMVHVPFADTISLQLSVAPNSELGVIVRAWATEPWLVTVNVLAALVCPMASEPNARDAGETVTGAAPVPVKEIVCVPTLSIIVTFPVSGPITVGVKVIDIVQLLPAARETGKAVVAQLFVAVKFVPVAFVLLAPILSIVSAAVPPLVSLTELAPLVALTATDPKVCEVAESVTLWASALGDIAKSNSAMPKSPKKIAERNFENMMTSLAG